MRIYSIYDEKFNKYGKIINDDFSDLYEVLGDRRVTASKEITKLYETTYRFNLSTAKIEEPKGEFVIVVEGAKEVQTPYFDITEEEHIKLYLGRGYSKKDAIKKVAEVRGISKNALYKYTIED